MITEDVRENINQQQITAVVRESFNKIGPAEMDAALEIAERFVIKADRDGVRIVIKAEDIGGAGAMALLLRQAFLPNLTQTLEGNPAFIHGGPFANIAHGNSSIIADRMALASADLVVTEAGFGSDMGAEKFMHIKAATSGKAPDCVVMNVTVRSMKLHGGAFGDRGGIRPDKATLEAENVEAVSMGAKTNLDRHIRNMAAFGVPVVVSINKFASDTDAEIAAITNAAHESGAQSVCVTEVHARGGEGGKDLAEAVVRAVQNHIADGRPFIPLFETKADVLDKATSTCCGRAVCGM